MDKILIAAIVPVVIGLLFAAAGKAKPIETEDGGFLIEYAKALKIFGFALPGVMLVGLVVMLFFSPIKDSGDAIAVAGLFAFMGLFAVYFYIEFYTVKIHVGPNGIRGTSGWRGKREYTWDEIDNITYSNNSMWFKLIAKDKAPLRIHAMISGINKVLSHFEKHMPQEKWIEAFEKYSKGRG